MIVESRNIVDYYDAAIIAHCPILYGVDDLIFKILAYHRFADMCYLQQIAETVALARRLIGVAQLKLLLTQFEIIVVHLTVEISCDFIGNLHREYRFTHIRVGKKTRYFALVPKTRIERFGVLLLSPLLDYIVGCAQKQCSDFLTAPTICRRLLRYCAPTADTH